MWIGSQINPDWLQCVFGVSNLGQLNAETITELPDQITTDESLRLKSLIRKLRTDRNRHMRVSLGTTTAHSDERGSLSSHKITNILVILNSDQKFSFLF